MYVVNRKEHIIQGLLLRSIELLQIIIITKLSLANNNSVGQQSNIQYIIKKAINEHVDWFKHKTIRESSRSYIIVPNYRRKTISNLYAYQCLLIKGMFWLRSENYMGANIIIFLSTCVCKLAKNRNWVKCKLFFKERNQAKKQGSRCQHSHHYYYCVFDFDWLLDEAIGGYCYHCCHTISLIWAPTVLLWAKFQLRRISLLRRHTVSDIGLHTVHTVIAPEIVK